MNRRTRLMHFSVAVVAACQVGPIKAHTWRLTCHCGCNETHSIPSFFLLEALSRFGQFSVEFDSPLDVVLSKS